MQYIILIFIHLSLYNALQLKYTQNEEALCLDGSQSSYYFGIGSGSGSNKYILHFEGGGWIEGLTQDQILYSAYQRAQTKLGSSKGLAEERKFSGLFSTDQSVNPDFYNWNMVHINYCDGSGHQGYRKNPIKVNGLELYFRGEVIVKQILSEVSLQTADTVIIAGCSAGGLAVYYWVEYIKSSLPETVRVLGVPDSGIFIDMPAYDGSTDPIKSLLVLQELVNQEVSNPSQECISKEKEQWKCFFAQYLIKYIPNVPLFLIQSLYDSASISSLLKLSCAKDYTLTNCNESERAYIEGLHSNIQIVIDGRFQTSVNNGAFGISCLEHCFLLTSNFRSAQWTVPNQVGINLQQSLSTWVKSYEDVEQYYNYHIDSVLWPGNSGCAS